MIPCSECLERFKSWGDDPRVRSGRYMKCGCDYCDKPTYYRELEARQLEPEEKIVIHRHSSMSKQDWDLLQQTARKLEYLDKKLAEHTEYKRKTPVKSGKRGMKIE